MRLLHITPTYAPRIGGVEEVVANLARMSRSAGIHADVAHVAPGLARATRDHDGLSVMTLPLFGHRMLGWAPGLEHLASGYDLLHVHDPQVGALTLNIFGRAARVPAVLSTHGGFFHTASARAAKLVHARVTAPLLLRRYARVLASSRTDLATFQRYSSRTVLAENGIDTTKFGTGSGMRRDLKRWIYWGRFSRNKRLDSLIRLVATLAERGIEVELSLCGTDFDGTLKSLQGLVRTSRLEDRIHIRTGLDDRALRAEIESCGVFVLPSEYEGFGLSLLEAMGAGLLPMCRDISPMNALAGHAATLLEFDGGEEDIQRVRNLVVLSPQQEAGLREEAMTRAGSFGWKSRAGDFLQHYEESVRNAR